MERGTMLLLAHVVIGSLQALSFLLAIIFFVAVIPTAWLLVTDDIADRKTATHRRARGDTDPFLQKLVQARDVGRGGIRSHRKGRLYHA